MCLEEPREQCTVVVFAVIVKEPASECVFPTITGSVAVLCKDDSAVFSAMCRRLPIVTCVSIP